MLGLNEVHIYATVPTVCLPTPTGPQATERRPRQRIDDKQEDDGQGDAPSLLQAGGAPPPPIQPSVGRGRGRGRRGGGSQARTVRGQGMQGGGFGWEGGPCTHFERA